MPDRAKFCSICSSAREAVKVSGILAVVPYLNANIDSVKKKKVIISIISISVIMLITLFAYAQREPLMGSRQEDSRRGLHFSSNGTVIVYDPWLIGGTDTGRWRRTEDNQLVINIPGLHYLGRYSGALRYSISGRTLIVENRWEAFTLTRR